MIKYCTVKGKWTTVISDIYTGCRFYRHANHECQRKEKCKHKTTNQAKVKFLGKEVKKVKSNGIEFIDGSKILFVIDQGKIRPMSDGDGYDD